MRTEIKDIVLNRPFRAWVFNHVSPLVQGDFFDRFHSVTSHTSPDGTKKLDPLPPANHPGSPDPNDPEFIPATPLELVDPAEMEPLRLVVITDNNEPPKIVELQFDFITPQMRTATFSLYPQIGPELYYDPTYQDMLVDPARLEYTIRLGQLQHLIHKTDIDETPFSYAFMDHSSTATFTDAILTELGTDPTFPGKKDLLEMASGFVGSIQRDQPGPFFDQR